MQARRSVRRCPAAVDLPRRVAQDRRPSRPRGRMESTMPEFSNARDLDRLRNAADAARVMSYAPYTGAVVLAAVRTTRGAYHAGCNVEVANISLSKHAEESAIMAALFFFSSRRRHTRCLSDWSSDVCSSD